MKLRTLLFSFFILQSSFFITSSYADVKYYVGKDGSPNERDDDYAENFKRFYIYGGYGLAFANSFDKVAADSAEGGPVFGLGARFTETIRAELAYERLAADYKFAGDKIAGGEHFGFLNFIFDAKLPEMYRLFKTTPIVPFVGFGAGAGYLDATVNDDPAKLELKRRAALAYNFIGGFSIEINETIALVASYKYIKTLPDELRHENGAAYIEKFDPAGRVVAAHFRISF
ncbi:MAG: porin family protein [Rickettsiales bacterium]|jgi:opacity protein-like surface antigen|nr:porin family protein [Rickettsiales bacterium]